MVQKKRASDTAAEEPQGQRGPADHEMRGRILQAAEERFRHYGQSKTTVADIAGDLGISTAYIYKFFESKLAIGEAVCSATLGRLDAAVWAAAHGSQAPDEKLRSLYFAILDESVRLFFKERKLHDLVDVAIQQRWPAIQRHKQQISEATLFVLIEGRQGGIFESRSPLGEVAEAVTDTLLYFAHPKVLEQNIDLDLRARARNVSNLVLRGLAP